MKLDAVRDSLEGTGISKMDVNVNSLTYSLMIDGIYTNKLGSVIREVSTNARDSLISAGKDSFELTIFIDDSTGDIKLSFKDEGMGLSEEDSLQYLCNLNASSKRDSDDFVGCFGIGSKSPFSLTDSYSFICVKDGIKTYLDLFRIDKETPRFNHRTEETTEVDSVNCIINLGSSYNIKNILEEIYKELSLFDIRPDLKFVSQSLDVHIKEEDFFPKVESFEDHYKIFVPCLTDETIKSLQDVGLSDPLDFLNSVDTTYRQNKQVSCGVVAYRYDELASKSLYGVRGYYNTRNTKNPYFSILKFGLDSNLSFDVSRENIAITTDSKNLIFDKIVKLYKDLGYKEVLEFLITIEHLFPRYSNPRGYYGSVFETQYKPYLDSDNGLQKTVKMIEKLKASFEYFKTKPDFINLILSLKDSFSILNDSQYIRYRSNFPTELTKIVNHFNADYSASFFHLIEKLVTEDDYFYTKDFNKGRPLDISSGLSYELKYFSYGYNNIFSGFDRGLIKKDVILSGKITDLSQIKYHFIYTNSRLKSERNLMDLERLYKSSRKDNLLEDNLVVYLVVASRKTIEDNSLITNLEPLRLLGSPETFSLKNYEDINPDFVKDLKPEPKPKKVSGSTETKEFSDSNIKLRNSITVVETTIKTSIPNRHLITRDTPPEPSVHRLETTVEETTSVKFSKHVKKTLPQFSDTPSRGYYGQRHRFVLLISSDIVENQEEKDAIILSENYFNSNLYFEFENPDYNDIKEVFRSLYEASDVARRSDKQYPSINYMELNKDYFDGSLLEEYRSFLGLCFMKYNIARKYFETLNSVEIPEEAEEYLESLKGSMYSPHRLPEYISETRDIKFSKLNRLLDSMGLAVSFDLITQFKNTPVLYLLNSVGKVSYPLDLKHTFSKLQSGTSIFGAMYNLEYISKFMSENSENIFEKLVDNSYLKSIEDEYTDRMITVNTEEIITLLKRF